MNDCESSENCWKHRGCKRAFGSTFHLSCFCAGIGFLAIIGLHAQTLTTLHSFTAAVDGSRPQSPMILSSNTLYGTTMLSGPAENGTVFKLNTDGTDFKTLYSFPGGDIAAPYGPLVLLNNALYETASGFICGSVFKVNTDG